MRKTDKSTIIKVLLPTKLPVTYLEKSYRSTIVDGGLLIHRVRWIKETTFHEIATIHVHYIFKHYRHPITIVFDGYDCAIEWGWYEEGKKLLPITTDMNAIKS